MYSAPILRRAIGRHLDAGADRILVDMRGVGFLDSTGLRVLVSAYRRLHERGGTLGIANAAPAVARVLEVTGLDRAFHILPEPGSATPGFRPTG